jgi:hypothetical protein
MIDPRHVVKLQGRDYVTVVGEIDYAHKNGLVSLETDLVQIPGPENQNTAIVKATAIFRGSDGPVAWSAHGDASPANTKGPIQTALLRMAETRAIGRVLRFACNIPMVAFEEVQGGEGDEVSHREPAPRTIGPVRHERAQAMGAPRGNGHAPARRDGGQAAPVATAAAGVEGAADAGPVRVTCEWTTSEGICGAFVEERLRLAGLSRYDRVICREHAAAAKAFYAVQASEQTLEMTVASADLGTGEIVSAQAQGY